MCTTRDLWRAAVLVWLCVGLVLLYANGGSEDNPPDESLCAGSHPQPADCSATAKEITR